jgi:hypothetical protein
MNMTNKGVTKLRSSKGQGIIEGVCGSLMVVLVFVLLTMLSLNVYSALVYSHKLQFVADTAARVYNERHFWLGTIRPDFKEDEARQKATETASRLLEKLGLPQLTTIEFAPEVNEDSLAFATVKLTVGGLKLPYGGNKVFPGFISLSSVGYSAETATTPYASYIIRVANPGGADHCAAVPAFGFATGIGVLTTITPEGIGGDGVPTAVGRWGAPVPGGKVNIAGAVFQGKTQGPNIYVTDSKSGRTQIFPFR